MMDALDDHLWDAVADEQSTLPIGDPIPGTLHGLADVKAPDVVCWACDVTGLEAALAAGYPQSVALVPRPGHDLFAPLTDDATLARVGEWQKIILLGGAAAFVGELARRLGRHRVWQCTWPEGCQDVADTMRLHGVAAVRAAIEGAEAWPIEGIYRTSAEAMLAHRRAPPIQVMSTGAEATDMMPMALPTEGKLVLVTGIPNNGKSTWVTHVMAHTALNHDRRWAVFSPEMGEWQELASQMIGAVANQPYRGMTEDRLVEWANWCRSRFAFLACDAADATPSLDWLIERLRACVMRDGTTDFLIDPWNEIDHDQGVARDDIYIGRALQRLKAIARRHGVNIWIVAHPTKLRAARPGDPVPVPNAYDINGGAAWNNKADMILCVHCPESVTEIHLLKARFRRWGRRGGIAKLTFNSATGRFMSVIEAADEAPGDLGWGRYAS